MCGKHTVAAKPRGRLVKHVSLSTSRGRGPSAFNAEAQVLARALRDERLVVLVGAQGVGKSTLLAAGVLPMLGRRTSDQRPPAAGGSGVVVPFPDRRQRAQAGNPGELLRCVDQWDGAALEALAQSLDEKAGPARAHPDLGLALSPTRLSALSQRHGGARLLFVFDHLEQVLENAPRALELRRFVDAWTGVLRASVIDAHFLVAIDEQAWPRMQALRARIPRVPLRAYRLQIRSGERALEAVADGPPRHSAPRPRVSDAAFKASLNATVLGVAKAVRDEEHRKKNLGTSLGTLIDDLGVRMLHGVPSTQKTAPTPGLEARAERPADERVQSGLVPQAVEAAQRAEAERIAQALAAAEAKAAQEVQARQAAEEQAEQAAQAAQAEQAAQAAQAAQVAEAPGAEADAHAPAAAVRPARASWLWGAALLL